MTCGSKSEKHRMPADCKIRGKGPPLANLTDLEYYVLAGFANGESVSSLATLLGISPDSALEARDALMEKLSAKSTADLVRIGLVARVRWP